MPFLYKIVLVTLLVAIPKTDALKSFEDICGENGFRAESHEVITEDGYMLNVRRIPGLVADASTVKKSPILMVHDSGSNMMQWLANPPDLAPAFLLGQSGYDVWIINNRGTQFSDKHLSLNKKDNEYWRFSWEEMGTMDIPAVIGYVLVHSGFEKCGLIGHGAGSTQILAGSALRPEYYNEKVSVAVLMATPTTLTFNPNKLAIGGPNGDYLSLIMDANPDIDNADRMVVDWPVMPEGAGYRNFIHLAQMIKQAEPAFVRYDYGPQLNLKYYGQMAPPAYNLGVVGFPIAMLSGSRDRLADTKDSMWTAEQLKPTLIFQKEYPIGHVSFAIGKDMTWFTSDVMPILEEYSKKRV